MISPKCNKCLEELGDCGATLFSPPNKADMVKKYHICQNCYDIIVDFIFSDNNTQHIQPPLPHAKATKKALKKLKSMSKEESLQTFIDAGIIDKDTNQLTINYK